jgi:hypothetical protein
MDVEKYIKELEKDELGTDKLEEKEHQQVVKSKRYSRDEWEKIKKYKKVCQ